MAATYRFGAVEIRPVERQLLVGGKSAAVGSRAFDVLLALAERRDRVVTKNELLDLAWPGLVVEENNLQAQVSALRRLLGPQAIATIPGRGYRFALAEGPDAVVAQVAARAPDTPTSSRTLRGGLPKLPAPLLGRDDELAALASLLEQHRLITVVGAAGIGKTVVAIAAAEERLAKLRDGTVWVELGPIANPALVPAAIAEALGVEASARADVHDALMAAVRNLQVLLIFDNAEHLPDAVAASVDAILAHAPGAGVIVTSRSALKLRNERIFRLGPLGVPEDGASLEEARSFGAIALLEARAQALDPRFALDEGNLALAIEICRHLDGIALAIELAAARLPLLGMRGLAERIGERFRLLASGSRLAPTRQQTLLAALDWSYDLLSAEEQKVFRRLGVFASGFSLATATAVACDDSMDEWAAIDALGALVDRSLVEVDGAALPRYRLLESARAYALLKLGESAGERAAVQRAHARAMLDLFEEADRESWVERETAWIATYGPELDNLRAALDWAAQHDPRRAVALLGASRLLFALRALDYELRTRCESLEPKPEWDVAPPVEARYWLARCESSRFVNLEQCFGFSQKSAWICRAIGDDHGLYIALAHGVMSAPLEEARRMVEELSALERPEWPARTRFWGKRAAAFVAMNDGRVREVGVLLEQALELARVCGADCQNRALSNIADHALAMGDVRKAVEVGEELLANSAERRTYHLLVVRGNLANALLQSGGVVRARELIALFHESSRAAQWDAFGVYSPIFALLAASEGRLESAARLLGYAERCIRSAGGQREPNEARAWDLALSRVDAGLDRARRDRLMAEGARLDEDAVCALTLEAAPASSPAKRPRSVLRAP